VSAMLSLGDARTSAFVAQSGTLDLHIRRMDTGQVDFGRYLVELPSDYMAGTTLALSASSGAFTIKVTPNREARP